MDKILQIFLVDNDAVPESTEQHDSLNECISIRHRKTDTRTHAHTQADRRRGVYSWKGGRQNQWRSDRSASDMQATSLVRRRFSLSYHKRIPASSVTWSVTCSPPAPCRSLRKQLHAYIRRLSSQITRCLC